MVEVEEEQEGGSKRIGTAIFHISHPHFIAIAPSVFFFPLPVNKPSM